MCVICDDVSQKQKKGDETEIGDTCHDICHAMPDHLKMHNRNGCKVECYAVREGIIFIHFNINY